MSTLNSAFTINKKFINPNSISAASDNVIIRPTLTIKDPGSSITHFVGMILAAAGTPALLGRAFTTGNPIAFISMLIFMLSMIGLYAASTTYHTFDISPEFNLKLKRIDHCMIPVLIAGSYTPICLLALNNALGYTMLGIVWGSAVIAILFKLFWVTCPRWISSAIYIIMGWTCIMAFPSLIGSLHPVAFALLLAGGIMYTVGGVIYALKMPLFNMRHINFGTHEIFHVFVMAGSACHYAVMYYFVCFM